MIVHIVTDASFCDATRIAAWAAWIKSERGNFFGGNAFPESHTDINGAELKAVAHAFRIGIKREIILDGDQVNLQTDSRYVEQRMSRGFMTKAEYKRWGNGKPGMVIEENFGKGSTRADIFAIIERYSLIVTITRSKLGPDMLKVDRQSRAFMRAERKRKFHLVGTSWTSKSPTTP